MAAQNMASRFTILLIILGSLTVFSVESSYAAPRNQKLVPSSSPQDVSEFRYHSQTSNDFGGSDRFQLDNPISVQVKIHSIYLAENGYAELFFTYADEGELRLPAYMPADTPVARFRRATLQTTSEVKKLKIKEKDFKKGVAAEITGWPATPIQAPYSEFLVDEILFTQNGKRYVFHRDSEKMVKYKDRNKPREIDVKDSEAPPDTAGE